MSENQAPEGKFMVNPYLDWAKGEGIPIHEDFGRTALMPPIAVILGAITAMVPPAIGPTGAAPAPGRPVSS